jgi:hypothetical protein
MYTDMVNKYYDLATSFYEYGACGLPLLGVSSCHGRRAACRQQLPLTAAPCILQQQPTAVHSG